MNKISRYGRLNVFLLIALYPFFSFSSPYDAFGRHVGGNAHSEQKSEIRALSNSTANNFLSESSKSNSGLVDTEFSTLISTVWDDLNGDGLRDTNEPGIAGIRVNLLDRKKRQLRYALSDQNGEVFFHGLDSKKKYMLEVIRPNQYAFAPCGMGNNPLLDSDILVRKNRTTFFRIEQSVHRGVDIGLWSPGAILLTVFDDYNGNHQQDEDEPGIPGVTINRLTGNNQPLEQVVSGYSGLAVFFNITPNKQMKIEVEKPQGATFVAQGAGDDDQSDSDIRPRSGRTTSFKLIGGAKVMQSLDVGLWMPGTVEFKVFDDLNGDGIQGINEPGLSDIEVLLLTGNNAFLDKTITGPTGIAVFHGVPTGKSLKLDVQVPDRYAVAPRDQGDDDFDSDIKEYTGRTASFQLNQGSRRITHLDGGLWSPGQVEMLVFEDTNSNGVRDSSEVGLSGIAVSLLTGNNELLQLTISGQDGLAVFHDVTPNKSYKIEVEKPFNTFLSPQDQSSNDDIDSDVFVHTGRTPVFRMIGGNQSFTRFDAGVSFDAPSGRLLSFAHGEAMNNGPKVVTYPNPADDHMVISGLGDKYHQIHILSLEGKLLQRFGTNGQGIHLLDITDLKAGTYFIRLVGVDTRYIRFVKQ